MEKNYRTDEILKNQSIDLSGLGPTQWENCQFHAVSWLHGALNQQLFDSCEFHHCLFQDLRITETTSFQQVTFKGCKLMGIDFSKVKPFLLSWTFEDCQMAYCSFAGLSMPKSKFIRCDLTEAGFFGCQMKQSIIQDCQLQGARFEDNQMEQCRFSQSRNYLIDPLKNKLKGSTFSRDGIEGLLHTFQLNIEY